MALPQSLLNLSNTLSYFDKYDYPLTSEELWYWQHGTQFSKLKIQKFVKNLKFKNLKLHKQREKFSKAKWVIARHQATKLAKLPFIAAIFVTGALAMDNCPQDDDIDLMIITKPNTLWIARFFVDIYLKFLNLRRLPNTEHRIMNINNRICDNLWLDLNNLTLNPKPYPLYIAHEILQAKCIFDRGSIHHQFLTQNSWVKKYLPVAYAHSTKKTEYRIPNTEYLILWPINLLFFIIQYLYMKPKMTTEKVGLGFAFFHPSVNIRN